MLIVHLSPKGRGNIHTYLPLSINLTNRPTNPGEKRGKKRGDAMGEGRYINPILTSAGKKVEKQQKQYLRKVRSDKLHDIKIPVNEKLDALIRREAYKNWGGSKTAISTELFLYGLNHLISYPVIPYRDGPMTVHIKIDHETYSKLGGHASEWKCSIRQAAHRIFMESLKKRQIGGVTNDEV